MDGWGVDDVVEHGGGLEAVGRGLFEVVLELLATPGAGFQALFDGRAVGGGAGQGVAEGADGDGGVGALFVPEPGAGGGG